jgi:hypothetical protein
MSNKKNTKNRSLKTSKIIIITLCFITLIITSQNITAHPPSNMNLKYDQEKQKLETTINHQVSNPNSHYIYKIEIKKNDETYKTYDYKNQTSSSSLTYTYEINLTKGDEIEVKASCNQGGSIVKKIMINDQNGIQEDSSTPGFEIIIIIISLLITISYYKRKK